MALFQSTHPSGVRPLATVLVSPIQGISIHAPQWGATWRSWIVGGSVRISIHAPQWGATAACMWGIRRIVHFNPRTPVGCDSVARNTVVGTVGFQSTHPSGVRHAYLLRVAGHEISIHAPQWGATTTVSRAVQTPTNFNPRTPVGCDQDAHFPKASLFLFQSTHPSGVRRAMDYRELQDSKFQSTHPSGVRPLRNA